MEVSYLLIITKILGGLLNIHVLDFDSSSYGGHYGSGYMQNNPSYNQASTHSSYSYHNPAFGHGTSSAQRSYPEDRTNSGYTEDHHHPGWNTICKVFTY